MAKRKGSRSGRNGAKSGRRAIATANSLNQPWLIQYLRRHRLIVEIRLRDRDAAHTRIRGRNVIGALRLRKRVEEPTQALLFSVFPRLGNHDVTSLVPCSCNRIITTTGV